MILTVKQIKKEAGDAFSIIFEKIDSRFYPGQYLNLGKEFTIASSPTEDFTMITTRKGISAFKKKLEKVKVGDKLPSDHPAGTFTIMEVDPAVFLAGGVGITPFRSMIKWAFDKGFKTPMTLIYSNSDNNFIYKDELDEWQKNLPNLKIHYINTSKNGRLNEKDIKRYTIYDIPNTIYYLAGPPAMVDDFENMLLSLGVDKLNIRTDRYDGY